MSCKKAKCTGVAKEGQRLCARHFQEACSKASLKIAAAVKKPEGASGCWTWTGATQQAGYGYVGTFGLTPNSKPAHWVSLFVSAPDEFDLNSHGQIHHTCKQVSCVNPAHLVHMKIEMHDLLHQLSNPKIAQLALDHVLEAFPQASIEVAALKKKIAIDLPSPP